MALVARLFVIAFGALVASLIAGMIIVSAMLFPEMTDLDSGMINPATIDVLIGFGFIFFSGFALLPALVVVLVTEMFRIRSIIAYGVGGALVGGGCYLGLIPFDPDTMRFSGIIRRDMEIMCAAGIVGGLIYWLIAGRRAGAWRGPDERSAAVQP